MTFKRAALELFEALVIVSAVWVTIIGGGIGAFYLLGWLLGAR